MRRRRRSARTTPGREKYERRGDPRGSLAERERERERERGRERGGRGEKEIRCR